MHRTTEKKANFTKTPNTELKTLIKQSASDERNKKHVEKELLETNNWNVFVKSRIHRFPRRFTGLLSSSWSGEK